MPISADDRRTSPAAEGSDSEAEPLLDDDEEYEEIEVEEVVEEEFEEEVEVEEEEMEAEEQEEDEEEEEEEEEMEAEEQEEDEEEEEEEEIEGEEQAEAETGVQSEGEEEEEEEDEEGEDEQEEEEEEEEEEEVEIGEHMIPIEEDHKQDSPAKESMVHEDEPKPVSSTLEKSLEVLPPDTTNAVEEGIPKLPDPIEKRQVAESSVDKGKHTIALEDNDKEHSGSLAGPPEDCGHAHYDSKTPPLETGVMNVEITEPSSVSNKELKSTFSMKKDKEVKGIVFSKEETKQIRLQAGKNLEQITPRSDIPLIRPRSLSPGAGLQDSNKRPAIICDFFAKGWCIKGSSCRFLHIKERVKDDISSSCRKKGGAVAAGNEGLRDSIEGSFSQEYGKSSMGTKSGSQDLHRSTISPFIEEWVPRFSRSLNSSSGHIAQWVKSSSPFSASSWNLDPLSTHKRMDSNLSIDSLHKSEYITKISSYNWEPSVPFKSEFLASKSSSSSSPTKQYDPIRDSIEQPKYEDGFSKSANKNSYGKDLLVPKTETLSFAKWKSRNIKPEEEKISSSKSDKVTVDSESAVQNNGPKPKVEVKVDRVPQSNEMDADNVKTDENTYQESRALKLFRVALIEYVKDLIKPAWRDGLLTKDDHKLIVKKAVDKILGSLPPNQVPSNTESTMLYLTSSHSKIAKLVHGYVDKYGKYDPTA